MSRAWLISIGCLVALPLAGCCGRPLPAPAGAPSVDGEADPKRRLAGEPIVARLIARHGQGAAARIRRGVAQVVARWRPTDGTAEELLAFCDKHFVADPKQRDDTFARLQHALEMIDGHAHTVRRELSRFAALDEGPRRPIDGLLAGYSPTAHVAEDLFRTKIAFVALLNFPRSTLAERVGEGRRWSRRRWAEARLTGRFAHRVPAPVLQRIASVRSSVRGYIDNYNVHMDRLVLPKKGAGPGRPLFPAGMKLISHWGLRDEIRAQYAKGQAKRADRQGALRRQRLIARVMGRIVEQQIPRAVIDDPRLQWDPSKNLVREHGGSWREAPREPDARYRQLKRVFDALRAADRYYPDLPSHRRRVFELDREMSEARVRALLDRVLTSKVAGRVAALLRRKLGRPLEAFDIWYSPQDKRDASELDRITRARYPDARAFQADLPRLLGQLGFDGATAGWLATRIVVDPSRGAGHAYGIRRRDDQAHLRTRVGKLGMDYKGYNIAVHELGHNVEQVLSTARVDHTLLRGVPNTGFSEAFAFYFQDRDLALLGRGTGSDGAGRAGGDAAALRTLDRFWTTFEIGGVAMLDIELWRFMYAHPEASPAELRRAMVRLARQVWNRYFAPVLGVRDSLLLAVYSHIIAYGLYTPDYPLGLLIAFQIDRHLAGKAAGAEIERICRLGRLAPDVWMTQAVGQPVSAEPLLAATAAAVRRLERGEAKRPAKGGKQ